MSNHCVSYCVVLFFFLFGPARGLLEGIQDHTIEARFETLTLEVKQLQQTVSVLQSQLNRQNVTQTGPVAFTAGLSKPITNMGAHQQIVFDNVITNIGNGYNPVDGHFTAAIRGANVFFVVLTNIPGHSSSIHLLKNGQWIGQAFAHGSNKDGDLYVTSTIAVTVQLQQGDRVWVQNEEFFSAVEEMDGYNWSIFSGHLVGAN